MAPSSQHASMSDLLGLPDTSTYSAAFTHPNPVVMLHGLTGTSRNAAGIA